MSGTTLFLPAAFILLSLIASCGGEPDFTLPPVKVVSTYVGVPGESGTEDATGFAARFKQPRGIVSNGDSLYVADMSNYTIRSITPASGTLSAMTSANAVVTTLAGKGTFDGHVDGNGTAARFYQPTGITSDGINLYIADGARVRKVVLTTGEASTLAGAPSPSSDYAPYRDGIGTSAYMQTGSITTDGNSLYLTDRFYTVRKISPASGTLADMTSANAVVTTLAGTPYSSRSADGIGTAARFHSPSDITTDGTNLYVTDTGNHTIRRITPVSGTLSAMTSANAVVTTLAGVTGTSGSVDGTGTAASFDKPFGIVSAGNSLYVIDELTIRSITPSSGTLADMTSANAVVTTLAETAGINVNGPIFDRAGSYPFSITTDGGSLYVTDTWSDTIHRITPAGGTLADMTSANAVVTTLAGVPRVWGYSDGIGRPPRFNHPDGITSNGLKLFVADRGNATIRQVDLLTGEVKTLAGSPGIIGTDDGIGSVARFDNPSGLTTDGSFLYCTDSGAHTVRRIDIGTGEVTTIGGQANTPGSADGPPASALFNHPVGITTDGINLYISDGGQTLRKLVLASGEASTLAGTADTPGSADGIGITARFRDPGKLTTDGMALYLADTGNHTIRRIAPTNGALSDMTGANAMVTTLAGTPGTPGSANGTGTAASFTNPSSVTSDGNSLYVTELNHTVRKITPRGGTLVNMTSVNAAVTTRAGDAGQIGYRDLLNEHGTSAQFNGPAASTTDGQYLYVTDSNNHTVRRIE